MEKRNPLSISQLGVRAYDTSAPSQIAYANVTIAVNRNPNAPFFSPSSYSRTVGEDFAPGTSLFQLTANDNDGVRAEFPYSKLWQVIFGKLKKKDSKYHKKDISHDKSVVLDTICKDFHWKEINCVELRTLKYEIWKFSSH